MGSVAQSFKFVVSAVFLLLPVVSNAETASTEYRHTVMTIENPVPDHMISSMRKVVQHNDHTAKIFVDLQKNTLFVVHHKSVSLNDLETSIADIGLSAEVVAQHDYRPDYKPILPHNPDVLLKTGRNCGATKETWKRLLRKYFH